MAEIINQQRKIKIEIDGFERFAEQAVNAINEAKGKNFTVAFVSDRRIKELNKIFRDKNRPTDVLSFPYEPDRYDYLETENFLGDIVISVEQAARQAAENNLTLENEIKQLILHGILHLVGYDHETDGGEMNRLELKLRGKLKV
ncbi:MAG TPA: rRNA maturation RNase YbeY [Pyrinomonadaceae bacterium]|nr:rRNA maturation RNase YbeY [Pyrinomonadaceae bacterium]